LNDVQLSLSYQSKEVAVSKKASVFFILSLLILFVFACTLPSNEPERNDPNIVFTAAAETVSAQLTEVALNRVETQTPQSQSSPPTAVASFTPLGPTSVPATEDNCDKAKFVTDVTISDGMVFPPDEAFTKIWRVKNIGTCTWTTSYALVFENGAQMGGSSPQALTGNVAPGETVDISVDLVSPETDGNYTGNWQIRNSSNVLFAKIYVQIKVASGDFAVTGVKEMDAFYISGRGASLVAKITANQAGKVEYHWILRESGQPDLTTAIEEVEFTASGTEEISILWKSCPHAGSFTAYLYIDDPNHQEFGETNFNCP
jgi:hypothetical protein